MTEAMVRSAVIFTGNRLFDVCNVLFDVMSLELNTVIAKT